MNRLVVSALASLLFACGGADKPAATAPAQPASAQPAAAPAAGHLAIVPFTMTMTSTKEQDGSKQVIVVRGDAGGVITIEADGASHKVARIKADGSIHKLEPDGAENDEHAARLTEAGALELDGQALPGVRLGEDGTLYRGDEPMLKIEGGKVIDVTGKALHSTVTMNGQVVSKTHTDITVEGGDEARRLAGLVLLLQVLPGRVEESSSAAPAAEPVPAPAPAPGGGE